MPLVIEEATEHDSLEMRMKMGLGFLDGHDDMRNVGVAQQPRV